MEKPFKCSFCDHSATSEKTLRIHLAAIHHNKTEIVPKIESDVERYVILETLCCVYGIQFSVYVIRLRTYISITFIVARFKALPTEKVLR